MDVRHDRRKRPHIELRRIAFVRRKTARTASLFDWSARLTPYWRGRTAANAEAGSSGAWPLRIAHRGPANAAGAQTSREAARSNDAACVSRCDSKSSRGAVRETEPVLSGFARTLARASNSPIGSAGPGGLRGTTSRRRSAHEHDATDDEQRVKKRRRGSPRARPSAKANSGRGIRVSHTCTIKGAWALDTPTW